MKRRKKISLGPYILSIVLNIERYKDELSTVLTPKKFKHNSVRGILLWYYKSSKLSSAHLTYLFYFYFINTYSTWYS